MADTISQEELYDRGIELMEEENYEKALRKFVYLRKHSKTYDADVHFNIAKCYHQLGNLDEAADTFKEVISYSLDKRGLDDIFLLEAYHILGLILKEKRQYEEALDVFESLIEFQRRSNLVVAEEVMKTVEQNIKECKRKAKPNIIDIGNTNRKAYRNDSKQKIRTKRKIYQKLKEVPKEEQRKRVEKMWKFMEENRPKTEEGSEWYIVSAEWFSQWKEWSGFSFLNTLGTNEVTNDPFEQTTVAAESKGSEPEGIFNEDIIELQEHMMLDQINLKDNLNEDEDYIIVSPEIWNYWYGIYDGIPIPRIAIRNVDSSENNDSQCIIEVNLVKLYTFEVPRDEKQDYYEVLLGSREWKLAQIKEIICQRKRIKEDLIRLWKLEKPQNLDKFYGELEYEWKKYRTLRLDGMLFHDLEIAVKDADFSRDDFLMIEYPIPTDNNNGYAIGEVEKKNIHEAMDETTAKVINEDESLKAALSNPRSLEFIKVPITILTKEESVKGAGGLSNLGNTCFMNSALQGMSQTQELTKYFLFNIHETEINHHNVLGSKGRVAEAYGELMKEMWCGTKRKTAPFEIKKSIGSVVAQFRGYNQQDSHEFLHYLIDILNEDLNRVKDKPYIEVPDSNERDDFIVAKEHWDAFCKRNDSVMVDLFYGQMKSHLVCLEGEYISNTFDPFSILSIPVPVVKHVKVKVTYFPINLLEIERVK